MFNLELTETEMNLIQKATIDYVITSKCLSRHEKDLYWNFIEDIFTSSFFEKKNIIKSYRALRFYINKYVYEDTAEMDKLSKKLLIYINEVK